jgi:transcriptional regulator with XRE-family HTH domain
MAFGQIISDARKKAKLSLRELAAKIKKEDGTTISPQYLNDLEHDRRNPPSDYLLQQFAQALDIPIDDLYYYADKFPPELRRMQLDHEQITEGFKAFRRNPQGGSQ